MINIAQLAIYLEDQLAERLDKAAELNPRYPNTFYNLGYIYAKTKNYPKAEEMFERTIALAPPFAATPDI